MLKVGDVFRGNPSFKFGRDVSVGANLYRMGIDPVQVSDSYTETYKISEVSSYNRKTGRPSYKTTTRHAHDDKTRPNAEFVVEHVVMSGGSEREFIQNEPHVTARRLNEDGSYNPHNELITFVDLGQNARSNFTTAVAVMPHRVMVKTVTFK